MDTVSQIHGAAGAWPETSALFLPQEDSELPSSFQ